VAIAVLLSLRAFAQTPPPTEAAPAVARSPVTMTWGGLVDVYYLYYFNPESGANSLTPPTNRAFDTNSNSMTLNYAKASLNTQIGPLSFQLDAGYGSTGTVINSANTGFETFPPPRFAAVPGSFVVQQAYGSISLPGNLALDLGKFVTTAGAEVIEANRNWLYSRSLLFNVIPLVHTGARLNLRVSEQVSLQASLVNGWNNDPDNNAFKTIGLSAAFTATPMVDIIGTGYFGKEATQSMGAVTPGDWTILLDLVAALAINGKVGVNVNFDYIRAPPLTSAAVDHQLGLSGMGRYVISDHVNIAGRLEWLQSRRMFATTNQGEVTAMAGLDVGRNFELRPEFRADFSLDQSGAYIFADGTKRTELTGTLAALTWF
jgi:hypothetical protein